MFGNSYQAPVPAWRQHVCGLCIVPSPGQPEKLYLPQVELHAHATIIATTSKTILTQTFINPSSDKGIREVNYTFPLYDGVSVVGFTCHVSDRMIVGEVKEKEKARSDFNAAVIRGETAGLFEQLDTGDVFSTTVGNVPPSATVVIKITYLGELKHDMEVDGIRFTMPNIIAPRYGKYPPAYYNNTAQNAVGSGISITIDAEMAEGSFIQKILSPSHPISISMGTTSIAPNAEPTMTKASATLSLGSAQLDNDFILQIVTKDTGVPKAVLETHPTIPNQRALMATLVPKFALPQENPEIVFVCDRSGSMSGSNITLVRQALQVFLKSLPVGVMFNICSFGCQYSFLWPKSVAYSQATLDEAVRHVDTFAANYGGTEMLAPVKATIEQRYKDIPLEMMLLTDGAIWDQHALFTYLNEQVSETKAPIRVYSLGVGAGVSHSLIEGIARAGNGFSQTVGEGEKMDAKVVRMLKGALSPHVNDYMLEVKYAASKTITRDDDFEIIDGVADSLTVKLDLNEKEETPKPEKPISLFDNSADPDKEERPAYDETGESRYSHLPKVTVPHIIQAPQNIPTLFAFNRTTVYLILGPDAPKRTPTSVVLRGTSMYGPLELEFPIQILDTPGETIHQLAVKKAMFELEQGRGWLPEVRDASGKLIKELYESRFDSMVEREAVRLGVQFQVSGKWCSFVAVEKKEKTANEKFNQEKEEWEFLETNSTSLQTEAQSLRASTISHAVPAPTMNSPFSFSQPMSGGLIGQAPSGDLQATQALIQANIQVTERGERLDTLSSRSDALSAQSKSFFSSAKPQSTGLFGDLSGSSTSSGRANQAQNTGGLFGGSLFSKPQATGYSSAPSGLFGGGLFGQQQNTPQAPLAPLPTGFSPAPGNLFSSGGLFGQQQQQSYSSPPSSLFSSGGLIEQQQQRQQRMQQMSIAPPPPAPAPIGGLFQANQSSSPAAPGSPPTGGLFGQNQQQMASRQQVSPSAPPQGNHALQDYQMQLMLFEQQNKKRLLMARQEQDTIQAQLNSATKTASAAYAPTQGAPGDDTRRHMPVFEMLPLSSPPAFSFGAAASTTPAAPPSPAVPNAASPPQPPAKAVPSSNPFSSPSAGVSAANPFGTTSTTPSPPPPRAQATSLFDSVSGGFGSAAAPVASSGFGSSVLFGSSGSGFGAAPAFGSAASTPAFGAAPASGSPFGAPPASTFNPTPLTDDAFLAFLVKLQTFEGYWEWKPELFKALSISEAGAKDEVVNAGYEELDWITALVIAFFEERLEKLKGSWELVVEKARRWLAGRVRGEGVVEELVNRARALV